MTLQTVPDRENVHAHARQFLLAHMIEWKSISILVIILPSMVYLLGVSSHAFGSLSPCSFYLPLQLSRECLRNLLHNTIIMDACAYQAVLYQTLSQRTIPMAIRLIHVSFSRPAMAENWTVSSVVLYILRL